MTNMEIMKFAKQQVADYYNLNVPKTAGKLLSADDIYIVWFCKTLQNWKALLATPVADGMYYEIIHNGDKNETYVDVYKKLDNLCVHS